MREIADLDWYKLQAKTLPQPLAFIMGRIARADGLCNQVDCIRRAAESLSRYVAIAQAASITYRSERDLTGGLGISLPSNFSWGSYIEVARKISKVECDHPLKRSMARGMGLSRRSKKNAESGQEAAIDQLEGFVHSRNVMASHSLVGLDNHKASQLLEEFKWEARLRESITEFNALLSMPLIVVTRGQYIKKEKVTRYRVLHYRGESDPFPIQIFSRSGQIEENVPYIVDGHRLISLAPGMVVDSWAPQHTGLYFIDGVADGKVRYRTIYSDEFRYRDAHEEWPSEEWCSPEDREQIHVVEENKNLRMLLAEELQSLDLKVAGRSAA